MTRSGLYRSIDRTSIFLRWNCLIILMTIVAVRPVLSQSSDLERQIELPRQSSTIYDLLSQISRQTGYFFIYDSELINNNERIRIGTTAGSMGSVLETILNDPSLIFRVIDQHVVIYRQLSETTETAVDQPETSQVRSTGIIIRGRILDKETGQPLPYATILIEEKGLGTTSNQDGIFHFRIQDDLLSESIKISYMGYQSQAFPLALLEGRNIDVMMETEYISMQEVIIRHYDPEEIVKKALANRFENYSNKPVYYTSFYREGVQKNRRQLNYSEAIFRIYKSDYGNMLDTDQAILLKSRKISDATNTDTLVLKIKAGVQSALELDILKTIPAFMNMEYLHELAFSPVDIVSIDGRSIYAIRFEQTNLEFLPVYSGIFFIDTESLAFVRIEFEVHPKHINKSRQIFLARLHRKYQVYFDHISYIVNYQYQNGSYHLNHVRGDMSMRIRRRTGLFSNSYEAFLEMVVCNIDNGNVSRFDRRESFRTQEIFVDQNLEYDANFWGETITIPPEKQVIEDLARIQSKIESIIFDE